MLPELVLICVPLGCRDFVTPHPPVFINSIVAKKDPKDSMDMGMEEGLSTTPSLGGGFGGHAHTEIHFKFTFK